ncbi:MAG: hypothetical protein CL693_17510 [Cellvibrionaceae bacterium]|nr:hypothetical protein [Cellvibrionaceae bacterium]
MLKILLLMVVITGSTSTHLLSSEPSEFRTIEWTELMPADDLEALLNPPEYLAEVEDGSPEDQISNQIKNTIAAATDDRYQQALTSSNTVTEMDGQVVRIPGFVVPLEFSDEMVITEFFIVPFFGACLHVPPPPPNQIIHVKYEPGFKLDELYVPFWFSGVLKTSFIENDTAASAYSLAVKHIDQYSEDG